MVGALLFADFLCSNSIQTDISKGGGRGVTFIMGGENVRVDHQVVYMRLIDSYLTSPAGTALTDSGRTIRMSGSA